MVKLLIIPFWGRYVLLFCENHLFKSILIHITTKKVGKKINTSFEKCAS